jgi:hypothetical protein
MKRVFILIAGLLLIAGAAGTAPACGAGMPPLFGLAPSS